MNGKKMILILAMMLMFAITARISAQQKTKSAEAATTTASTATTTTAAAPPSDHGIAFNSAQVRDELREVLRDYPPQLATILVLDQSLLADEAFLAHYPRLAQFVNEHPEVRHQTSFYLQGYELPGGNHPPPADEILGPLFALVGVLFVVFAAAWVIRTFVEQKRWSRLARTQSEVHNKILDRFGTTPELLEYMKTPAGAKFLESAPIPLHTESAPSNAPLSRVMWSIQAGVIVVAASVGMLYVSGRFAKSGGDGLFAIGAITLCVGLGFIVSALISLFLSRRLAMNEPADALAANQ